MAQQWRALAWSIDLPAASPLTAMHIAKSIAVNGCADCKQNFYLLIANKMRHLKKLSSFVFVLCLSVLVGAAFNSIVIAGSILVFYFLPSEKFVIGLNNIDARMVFNNATQALARAFNYPAEQDMLAYFKMTQNALRLEQPIIAGQTLYTFPVLNNQGTTLITEQRMKLQDTNVIYQIGIFFGLATGDTDPAEQLFSYPNQIAFPAGAAAAMQALYNGQLLMTINNDQVLTQWDIARHFYKGETQQTAALGAGSPGDELRLSEDGFYAMEPNVTLIGQKDNNIQIKLPQGGIATVTANSRIVIILRTILAQNSTAVS